MQKPSLMWILRYIRKIRKISQKSVMEIVGYKTITPISEKERDLRRPPIKVLSKWLEALQIPEQERRWFYRQYDFEVWMERLDQDNNKGELFEPLNEKLVTHLALFLAHSHCLHPEDIEQFDLHLFRNTINQMSSQPSIVNQAEYAFSKGEE